MHILWYILGISTATVAAIGILINLCIFVYEFLVGRTISFLPIVPSGLLATALAIIGITSWYWALLAGVGHCAFEVLTIFAIDRYGKDARRKNIK